jgi:hypothetical protein
MGQTQLKTRLATALLLVLLGVFVQPSAPRSAGEGAHAAGVNVSVAGFGGVLVPKRVRLILGFVQTLPA